MVVAMAKKPVKRMTLTVKDVSPGGIKGQLIVTATGRKQQVMFDVVADLIQFKPGDKIKIELYPDEPPSNLDKYEFCGHGYLVSKPGDPYTIFSIWGILFKFEPPIEIEPNRKYYLCITGSEKE